MDDFLHNLRNGNQRRYDRPRRTYDGNQYNKQDNRRGGNNRPYSNNRSMIDNETLTAIRKSLEDIGENQHRMIAVQERRAAAEERKAGALEALSESLAQLVRQPVAAVPSPQPPAASEPVPAATDAQSEARTAPAAPETSARTDSETATGTPPAESHAAPPATRTSRTRDQLVAMIKALRNDGMSYEKIANHLEENNVGTLSGRGQWRGQSVHRLFHE